VNLLETEPVPQYQRTALKARHLRRLGLAWSAIAKALGVTAKAAKRAAGWRAEDHQTDSKPAAFQLGSLSGFLTSLEPVLELGSCYEPR
jgi:hypothetical protein